MWHKAGPKGDISMNKLFKIVGIVVLFVVIVIIGLTIFVKSYLTDARVRSFITQTAESSLHRNVSLGPISVSIFSGISVKDFEIKEKDSNADFVKAGAFVLKYQLLPLLSRKLIIDRLAIESPSIVIRRNADGSFNFSDMMQHKGETTTEKKEGGGSSGLPVSLSVQSLRIDNGRLEYLDPSGRIKKALVGLNAGISIQGKSRDLVASAGKARMELVEVVFKNRPQPLKDIPLSLQYSMEANLAEKRLEILDSSLTAPGIPATISGTVTYGEPFSYAVKVGAPSVNLITLQKSAAAFLPQGINLSGSLSVKVAAEQKPVKDARPVYNGQIRFDNVAVQVKDMKPVFNGTVTITPDQIGLKAVKLVAGDSSADISGSIANYATSPDVRIDVRSAMLNLDKIMPPSGKGKKAGVESKKKEKEFGPLKTKITAEGNVAISKLLVKGITLENLKAHYVFRNNVFTLASLTGNTLSGGFSVKSTVDLSKKGTVYSMNAGTDGIKLEDVAAVFAPKAKGIIFGGLSARADISGAGTVGETIKRNLKGKGTFNVRNGEIKNAPISNGLLAILGLQSLKEIPIEKAEGAFTISGGVTDLKSIISSKDLVIDETGTIGLDQRLNMGVVVKVSDRLSPKLLAQSGISQFLSEEKGWTAIPLKLTGTIAKPSYGVDTQAVGRRATKTIKKRIEKEIFKALSGDKKGAEPSGTPAKSGSPEDLLKGFFK